MRVELKRIGWENGTLVSKAKANIGGTIYEVEPAQYSGKSPMSAENLKKMEDNAESAINEATEKNIITGEEFETNKFIDGKRVYGKRINCGNLPGAQSEITVATGINFPEQEIVRIEGIATSKSKKAAILLNTYYNNFLKVQLFFTNGNLRINSEDDRSTYVAYVTLYYTKN